jgi:ferrochelatase
MPYDALLVLSFGGPEGRDDVLPFLENVLRGKNVPRSRMLEVADHYYHFGGVSPINAQCRALISALEKELEEHGPKLPIYWGNRNWTPYLPDTLRQMRNDGVRRALGLVTSAFSSYSGCRQYLEDIERARQAIGPGGPTVDKLRSFYNHPGFLEPMIEKTGDSLAGIPAARRPTTEIIFTAHSIPTAMANGCAYVAQLREACEIITAGLGSVSWNLAYQSRSGPPTQTWLEPDISDLLRELARRGNCTDIVVVPIGFISDHIEVLFDLDTEARELCGRLGLTMHRVPTVGTHPRFIRGIRELILERTSGAPRLALGQLGPCPDVCPLTCCLRAESGERRAESQKSK